MEAKHPASKTRRRKSWRMYLTIPAILAPAVKTRIKEVKRGTFSQHAIETVCFDLRIRRAHAVTGQFARELPEIQDAIDRFIVAHYRPGMKCDGGTLRELIFNELPAIATPCPKGCGSQVAENHDVYYPPLLVERIEERWRELGFESLSEYVTSVMRYDLLLGGKHRQFPNNDYHPEILAALDRETLAEFLANRKPKILVDFLLEEAAKRELTREECETLLQAIGRKLRAIAVEHYL